MQVQTSDGTLSAIRRNRALLSCSTTSARMWAASASRSAARRARLSATTRTVRSTAGASRARLPFRRKSAAPPFITGTAGSSPIVPVTTMKGRSSAVCSAPPARQRDRIPAGCSPRGRPPTAVAEGGTQLLGGLDPLPRRAETPCAAGVRAASTPRHPGSSTMSTRSGRAVLMATSCSATHFRNAHADACSPDRQGARCRRSITTRVAAR